MKMRHAEKLRRRARARHIAQYAERAAIRQPSFNAGGYEQRTRDA